MAAFDTIMQGDPRTRRVTMKWEVVNTSLKDEAILMRDAFLPLAQESLDRKDEHQYLMIYRRFFDEGKFLFATHIAKLNELLRKHTYPEVELPFDGEYFQPVMGKAKSPSAEAWLENGKARTDEFEAIVDLCYKGKLRVPQKVTA